MAYTEQVIIQGCIDGEEKYCKMLFDSYYGKMLNVCKRYARDTDEAKDVLQEGFIRVFKNIRQFENKGSFEGWIRRIMVNTAINHYKKNNLRSILDYVSDEDLMRHEKDSLTFDNNEISVEIEAETLLKIVEELPPIYKVVFNLSVMEDYSHKEIAETLNITESTSRSNLTKARIKLKERITELQTKKKFSYAG